MKKNGTVAKAQKRHKKNKQKAYLAKRLRWEKIKEAEEKARKDKEWKKNLKKLAKKRKAEGIKKNIADQKLNLKKKSKSTIEKHQKNLPKTV